MWVNIAKATELVFAKCSCSELWNKLAWEWSEQKKKKTLSNSWLHCKRSLTAIVKRKKIYTTCEKYLSGEKMPTKLRREMSGMKKKCVCVWREWKKRTFAKKAQFVMDPFLGVNRMQFYRFMCVRTDTLQSGWLSNAFFPFEWVVVYVPKLACSMQHAMAFCQTMTLP